MRVQLASLLAVSLLAGACAEPPRASKLDAFPEPAALLVDSRALEVEFLMRQRLRFEFGERTGSFDAVVQVHCAEVVVIGLNPLGARLFTIRQRGIDVDIQQRGDFEWPVPPLRILLDVHRVYLYPRSEEPPQDGSQSVRLGPLEIVEHWRGGRVIERVIPDHRHNAEGKVIVTFEDGLAAGGWPMRAHLRSELDGYQLEVETVTREVLRCDQRNQ